MIPLYTTKTIELLKRGISTVGRQIFVLSTAMDILTIIHEYEHAYGKLTVLNQHFMPIDNLQPDELCAIEALYISQQWTGSLDAFKDISIKMTISQTWIQFLVGFFLRNHTIRGARGRLYSPWGSFMTNANQIGYSGTGETKLYERLNKIIKKRSTVHRIPYGKTHDCVYSLPGAEIVRKFYGSNRDSGVIVSPDLNYILSEIKKCEQED